MADKVMGKQKSCTYKTFVHGGNHSMFGKSGVGAQEPGVTATTRHGSSGSFKGSVRGGSNHMFGKQTVKRLKPA